MVNNPGEERYCYGQCLFVIYDSAQHYNIYECSGGLGMLMED